jgi:hypothetical protein
LDHSHRCDLSHNFPIFNKRGINALEPGQRVKIFAFSLHVRIDVQSESATACHIDSSFDSRVSSAAICFSAALASARLVPRSASHAA